MIAVVQLHPHKLALVVSTECITHNLYLGNNRPMLVPGTHSLPCPSAELACVCLVLQQAAVSWRTGCMPGLS